jgi:transcriptional regulator with XRE-family HTH domain
VKSSRSRQALPTSLRRALKKLGQDISAARRRRRLPVALMAERAFISRNTLGRVEKGDAGVSMGIYASVLFVLGMADRLGDLADAASDRIGLSLEEERLPRRIRTARPKPPGVDHET